MKTCIIKESIIDKFSRSLDWNSALKNHILYTNKTKLALIEWLKNDLEEHESRITKDKKNFDFISSYRNKTIKDQFRVYTKEIWDPGIRSFEIPEHKIIRDILLWVIKKVWAEIREEKRRKANKIYRKLLKKRKKN